MLSARKFKFNLALVGLGWFMLGFVSFCWVRKDFLSEFLTTVNCKDPKGEVFIRFTPAIAVK